MNVDARTNFAFYFSFCFYFFYVSLLPAITVFKNLPHQSDRVSVSIFAWTTNLFSSRNTTPPTKRSGCVSGIAFELSKMDSGCDF